MFRSANQLDTVAWLVRTLDAGEPFAAVTGEAGVGKTAVAAAAAELLAGGGYVVVQAGPPFAGPLELQKSLTEALGLQAGPQTTPTAIAAALRDRSPSPGGPAAVVLLIDGAEHLPATILHYLWLMRRLNGVGPARLQVVFLGRFGFWDRFAGPELNELRSEVAARFVVLPLPPEEALAYARHRLVLAGAAEPVVVPRRLAGKLLELGQGNPARLNLIVGSVAGREPANPRLTSRGLHSAAAALADTPVRRPAPGARRRWRLVGTGLAAAVLLAAGALWEGPRGAAPVAVAAVQPPPASPESATPRQPAPARTPEVDARLVAPVALGMPVRPAVPRQASTPPAPAAAPMPDGATLRVSLSYAPADPAAPTRAGALAARLRGRGLWVADPTPASGAPRATTVEYFFVEDRDQAEQVARELGGNAAMGHASGPPEPPPPPGALRIVLSDRGVNVPP